MLSLTVDVLGDAHVNGHTTLRDAVAAAADTDTIDFSPSLTATELRARRRNKAFLIAISGLQQLAGCVGDTRDFTNRFLTSKTRLVESQELNERTWHDYGLLRSRCASTNTLIPENRRKQATKKVPGALPVFVREPTPDTSCTRQTLAGSGRCIAATFPPG
jgi:hypothetical protein